MFINNYCLFYTCVILLCHVGEGPVLTALVLHVVIPKDILFKHATANNVQYESDRIIKWKEFPALIDL